MGFLGMLAQGRSQAREKDQAQRFQDVLMQQKQAEGALDARYKESQIGENDARAESLRRPQQGGYDLEAREDGTYVVNKQDGTARLIPGIPGVKKPDPVATAVEIAKATKGIPTYGDLHPREPAGDRTLVPVQEEEGVVYRNRSEAEGQNAPSPNARGNAAILKDIATNKTNASVIDDALKELDAHPDAVGLKRGAADLPFIGGAADAINQRVDPEGVAARASLANISSLVIKDRSGAAVTISESARLRPFIPSTGDTPKTIRTKLRKLRQAIETETALLQQASGRPRGTQSPAAPQASEAQQLWDAAVAKHGEAKVLQSYGPRPEE